MLRKMSVASMLVLVLAASGFAEAKDHDNKHFSNANLHGRWVLHVGGFDANEATAPFHTGEVGALGLLRFDGNGGVSGTVNFTTADSGGDQAQCGAPLDASSSYSVSSDGTGTLTLVFPTSNACVAVKSGQGMLVFNFAIDGNDVKNVSLLLNTFSSGLAIAGEPIQTLVFTGGLTARNQ